MHSDAHDAGAGEARELRVLELLAQGPGYEVAARQLPLREVRHCGGAADGALQRNLNDSKHVRQCVLQTERALSRVRLSFRELLRSCPEQHCAPALGHAQHLAWNQPDWCVNMVRVLSRRRADAFAVPKTCPRMHKCLLTSLMVIVENDMTQFLHVCPQMSEALSLQGQRRAPHL